MNLKGLSGLFAEVNAGNELEVRARTERTFLEAVRRGKAFSADSGERDIDTGDTMLFIKNISTKKLVVSHADFNGSNVICNWQTYVGKATTTPSGTAAAVTNLKTKDTSMTGVIAYYDETAVADGALVARVWTPVTNIVQKQLDLILWPGEYIQFNQITESTSGSVVAYCFFDYDE